MKGFASDNNSGVHPLIINALNEANKEHALAYGEDGLTKKAEQAFKSIFGEHTEAFFVFNGTAANVLGLSAVSNSYHAILCAETAHINTDECGAPERFTGCKILTAPSTNGKLNIHDLEPYLHAFGFQHHSQPKIISISQATEMGTLYSLEEIRTIADFAHQNQMLLHIDGARIANAAASLNCSLAATTVNVGADLLSFGGTKNGLMYGEAIVFFNTAFAKDFLYQRKQAMQLGSKMRYISAQFLAYLQDELWRKTAIQANQMAQLLAKEASRIKGIQITQKVEANGVFALVPSSVIEKIQNHYFFYVWDETTSEVRWMTSWDTTEEEILHFTGLLAEEMDLYHNNKV